MGILPPPEMWRGFPLKRVNDAEARWAFQMKRKDKILVL
jgi:hypothetical protein